MDARRDWLLLHHVQDKDMYLFFTLTGDHGCLSANTVRKLKSRVEAEVGTKFSLQDCRRAFGQHYKDKGVEIEVISKLMGHNNTKTTEDYYCGMRQSEAVKKARGAW